MKQSIFEISSLPSLRYSIPVRNCFDAVNLLKLQITVISYPMFQTKITFTLHNFHDYNSPRLQFLSEMKYPKAWSGWQSRVTILLKHLPIFRSLYFKFSRGNSSGLAAAERGICCQGTTEPFLKGKLYIYIYIYIYLSKQAHTWCPQSPHLRKPWFPDHDHRITTIETEILEII